jgi:hypothetical protein
MKNTKDFGISALLQVFNASFPLIFNAPKSVDTGTMFYGTALHTVIHSQIFKFFIGLQQLGPVFEA